MAIHLYNPDSDKSICIYHELVMYYAEEIQKQMIAYTKRWKVRLSSHVIIVSTVKEIPPNCKLITFKDSMHSLSIAQISEAIVVPSIGEFTAAYLRAATIQLTHTWYSTIPDFERVVQTLPDIIACDFEAASKYSDEEKEQLKLLLPTLDYKEQIRTKAKIDSDGLSQPDYLTVTHLSIGISETEAVVFVVTPETEQWVLNWLVTTDKKQIWHNASSLGIHEGDFMSKEL